MFGYTTCENNEKRESLINGIKHVALLRELWDKTKDKRSEEEHKSGVAMLEDKEYRIIRRYDPRREPIVMSEVDRSLKDAESLYFKFMERRRLTKEQKNKEGILVTHSHFGCGSSKTLVDGTEVWKNGAFHVADEDYEEFLTL